LPIAILVPIRIRAENPQFFASWESPYDSAKRENALGHTKWDCKYHVVFIPKYRRKTLYGELRKHLGEVFRKLAVQKESKIEEGI
jgi:Transposase IS200 like